MSERANNQAGVSNRMESSGAKGESGDYSRSAPPSLGDKKECRNFVFGYGSLICANSRAITAPTLADKEALPVVVMGLTRTWTARIACPIRQFKGRTAMGVDLESGKECSGVLIEVTEEELAQFDEREESYDRHQIDLQDILPVPHQSTDRAHLTPPNDQSDVDRHIVLRYAHEIRAQKQPQRPIVDNDNVKSFEVTDSNLSVAPDSSNYTNHSPEAVNLKVWVYIHTNPTPANKWYPITQTYIDVILKGCLSISEDFAISFLQTTHGWWHDHDDDDDSNKPSDTEQSSEFNEEKGHFTWVEDRKNPLYVRADFDYSQNNKEKLDDLIRTYHSDSLEKRFKLMVPPEDKEK